MLTHCTEERLQLGCSNWPQGFSGYSFTLIDDEKTVITSGSFRKIQKRKVLYLQTDNLFWKTSVSFMNNPQDKTKNRGEKVAYTTHPTKCALLTQPPVQSSFNPWGSYNTERRHAPAHPTHTQSCPPRTHAGNGFTISLPDKEKAILCLEKKKKILQESLGQKTDLWLLKIQNY